eukprot:1476722-Alexandrium_andersonii.AAC.1
MLCCLLGAELVPVCQALWDELNNKPKGKEHEKRECLVAWLKDPNMGEAFWKMTKTISASKTMKRKEKWLSKAKLIQEVGESEAEELIAEGLVLTRPSPMNPKRTQGAQPPLKLLETA